MTKTSTKVTSFQYPKCESGKTWTMEKGCQNSSNFVTCTTPSQTSVTTIDSTNNKVNDKKDHYVPWYGDLYQEKIEEFVKNKLHKLK